jgi:exonuclease III
MSENTPSLKIATLNIMDARRTRLNAALRCMSQMNVDLGILTETKLSHDKYAKMAFGYAVVATKASATQGGVALFYRKAKGWSLESTRTFGPNVIRTTLVSGQKRWYIIGAYIPPSEEDGSTLECITQARNTVGNHRWPVVVLGDLNVDFENLRENRGEGAERRVETAALMGSLGLRSIRGHFCQRKGLLGRYWTWRQRRQGVLYGSICDHILTDKRNSFLNCQIKTPRFDSDHRVLIGTMRLQSERHHRRYVGSRTVFPIPPLGPLEGNRADGLLEDLSQHARSKEQTDGRHSSWISAETWRLIDRKAFARRGGIGDAVELQTLKRLVRRALKKDRQARCEAVANTAQTHLEGGRIREAFGALKGWYRDAGPRPSKPSREDINLTRAEYKNLFAEEAPSEDPIPTHVDPFTINDAPPDEDEVVAILNKLRNNKAAGVSGLTAEDLKSWHEAAQVTEAGEEPDRVAVVLWAKVLEMVRLVFEEGEIPRAFSQGIFVLIPKAKAGEFRGIALLEIIYKLVSSIINSRIQAGVTFHDAIHGFRPGRGTSTAIMEAKLLAQVHCRSDDPLYMVFIDLKKAYDTLDRTQAMRILKEYGVGANLRRAIRLIWEGDTMVPRQSGYFGRAFRARRGVRQGDIMSPLIFNIMVDVVIRHWQHQHPNSAETVIFYADDGMLAGTDAEQLQESLDIVTKGFGSLGLKMNAEKTEFMVMSGGNRKVRLSTVAYARKCTGEGLTHRARQAQKVQCLQCGAIVGRQYLKIHRQTAKCQKASLSFAPPTPVRERVAVEQAVSPVHDSNTYRTSIPRGHGNVVRCPADGCRFEIAPAKSSKRRELRLHFRTRHLEDTIIIEEEGQLPRCDLCGFFGNAVGTDSHKETVDCKKFAERRRQHFQAKRQESAREVSFTVNGTSINRVSEFKYLGRILEESDDDAPAANRQLERARERWGRMSRVLAAEGASPKVMGYFYKAIIQAVLLYGSESWTLPDRIIKKFRSFHARVARYITGRHIRELEDGTYFCPPTVEVLNEAGLETMDEYMLRRRQTIRGFVRHRTIYETCLRSRALSTNVNKVVWWTLD